MKKLLALCLLFTTSVAMGNDTAGVQRTEKVGNSAPVVSNIRLGSIITREVVRLARANYNFALQGGSSAASINLQNELGVTFKLPNKAVITNCLIDVQTALTSDGINGTATISLGANTAVDLKAATNYTSYTGIVACIPVNTAATAIKLTADRSLTMRIGTSSLSAGKFSLLVEYYLSE